MQLVLKFQTAQNALNCWMSSNRLLLNQSKSQLIWLGTRGLLQKIDFQLLSTSFPFINFLSQVSDLGVIIDSQLTFRPYLSSLSRSCFYQLRQLRTLRRSLSTSAAATLVRSFVCSRVDYCSSLLVGLPAATTSCVQSILRAAARLVAGTSRYSAISSYMQNELHWLPLHSRVEYRVLRFVASCLNGLAPAYLTELCVLMSTHASCARLRSSSHYALVVPRSRTTLFQKRSFASAGPLLWNRVDHSVCHLVFTDSMPTFLAHLKTYFFRLSTKPSSQRC